MTLESRLLAATHTLPFSDELVEVVLKKWQFVHVQPLETESVNPVTSNSLEECNRSPNRPIPATNLMSYDELRLLRLLIDTDPVIVEAIRDGQSLIAAQRWNSFLDHVQPSKLLPAKVKKMLHRVTQDVLEKGVLAVNERAKKDTEHQYVSYTAQGLEHEMAIKSIHHAPWTQYEMDYLISLVPRFTKHNKKHEKYVQWTDLQYAWVIRQMSEVRAKQDNRLTARDASTLKAQWLTYTRTTKSPAIINPPPVVEPLMDSDVITAAEIAETFDNDVSTTITQTENNTTLSKKKFWSVEEDQMFQQLYKERDGRWSYVEFCAVWPPDLTSVYGTPTSKQWSNKNNTVRKKGVKRPRP